MSMKGMGAVTALMLCVTAAHAADTTDMLPFALMGGTPSLDVRLRSEHVDNISTTQTRDSDATTLRARLGFTSGKWNDFDLGVEYEGVTAFDKFDYNNMPAGLPGSNGQTNRPVIADSAGSELNQAWLRYAGIPKTELKAGRQRVLLDNQRWIGNVGWRQNEQTFDGAVLTNKALPGTELTYAYFHNVDSAFFATFPLRAHIGNASWSPGAYLKATAYGYWVDFALPAGARQDSRTLGARLAGAPVVSEDEAWKVLYAAEYAKQGEYKEASSLSHTKYVLGELGGAYTVTQLKVGYEVLGSNAGLYALQTPLATYHMHDGWDDMFLTTPVNGLRRTYATLGSTVYGFALTGVVHRFKADFGGAHYGDEYDASVGYTFNRQLSGLIKYARYDAKETPATTFATNVDTDKGWLQLEYKF